MSPLPHTSPAPATQPPQTVILVHPRERRSKCSVEPLRTSPDFVFVTWPDTIPISLAGYVRLGIGGPMLSDAVATAGCCCWTERGGWLPTWCPTASTSLYAHCPQSSPPTQDAQGSSKIPLKDSPRSKHSTLHSESSDETPLDSSTTITGKQNSFRKMAGQNPTDGHQAYLDVNFSVTVTANPLQPAAGVQLSACQIRCAADQSSCSGVHSRPT